MADPVNYNTLGTPAQIAMAKTLAGGDADTMCIVPDTRVAVWTPMGARELIKDESPAPLWTSFIDFVKTVPDCVPAVEPAV